MYVYGAVVALQGVFLLLADPLLYNSIRGVTGGALILAEILAVFTVYNKQRKEVQSSYHAMHALAMFVYGFTVLFFCDTIEKLAIVSEFLFIFYAFSEIIFCSWLFNMERKITFNILFLRIFIAFGVGAGTIFAMQFSALELKGFGMLFIAIGINIMLYVPIMRSEAKVQLPMS
jgi:hypothetical protein